MYIPSEIYREVQQDMYTYIYRERGRDRERERERARKRKREREVQGNTYTLCEVEHKQAGVQRYCIAEAPFTSSCSILYVYIYIYIFIYIYIDICVHSYMLHGFCHQSLVCLGLEVVRNGTTLVHDRSW